MKKKILLTVTIIVLILSTSCMRKANKKPMKVEQKQKAPKTLIAIRDGVDDILKKSEEIQKMLPLTEEELKIEKPETKKDEGGTAEDKKDKDKEKKPIPKDEVLIKEWKDIDKKIEEVHKQWNSYEVEGVKKGATDEKRSNFKKNLNLFTLAVENRKITDIIDTGSKAYLSMATFFDLYKDDISGDLSRIKHAVHQSYLGVERGNIENAKAILGSTEEYIPRIKQKLGEDKTKIKNLEKLSLGISDMKQSLNEKNIKLLAIKRDIVLKNLKELEK